MVLFPVLLLLISSLIVWVLQRRHPRIHWFVASFGAFLTWVAVYLLANQLPIQLEFSIWQPRALFSTPLILSMDEVTWPFVVGISGVLLVISLSMPAREIMVSARERVSVLIYTCLSFVAVLAGNILSVVTAWMLMDVFIFALSLRGTSPESRSNSFLWWFGKNLFAIVLLVLAAVINMSVGGGTPFKEQISTTSLVLVIFSSLLRMPFPAISKDARGIGWIDTGNNATLELFPMITGLAVIARVFNGTYSEGVVIWLYIIGGAMLGISLVSMSFFKPENHLTLLLNLGVLGIGILLVSSDSLDGRIIISAVGVIMLSLNAWLQILNIHEKWHAIVPILFSAMVAGMIGSPGGVLSQIAAQEFLEPGTVGIELLIWIGMGVISVLYIRFSSFDTVAWKSAENLTITSYSLALMLFVANAFLIGMKMSPEISVEGIVFFLSVSLFAGIFHYSMSRMGFQLPLQHSTRLRLQVITSKIQFFRVLGEGLFEVISAVGRVFEGETGLLWALVILQLLVLALGSLS